MCVFIYLKKNFPRLKERVFFARPSLRPWLRIFGQARDINHAKKNGGAILPTAFEVEVESGASLPRVASGLDELNALQNLLVKPDGSSSPGYAEKYIINIVIIAFYLLLVALYMSIY